MSLRFQTKLSLCFILLLATVQLLTLSAIYWQTSTNVFQQLEQQLQSTHKLLGFQLEDISSTLSKKMLLLTNHESFKNTLTTRPASLYSQLHQFGKEVGVNRILLVAPTNDIVIDTELSQTSNTTFPLPRLLTLAKQEGKISALFVLNHKIYQWIILPLISQQKTYWLALGTEVEPLLKKDLKLLSSLPTDIFFAHQSFNRSWQWINAQETTQEKVNTVLAQYLSQSERHYFRNKDEIFFVFPFPAPEKSERVIAFFVYSLKDILTAYRPLLYHLILIGLLGIVILFTVSILIARNMTKTLHHMTAAISRIKQGNYNQPIPNKGSDEIGQLVGLFNQIMQGIETHEKALFHQSRHDPITTLPNRIYFFEQLSQWLAKSDPARDQMAIIAIGIDRFPQINHALGHHIGDRLLHHVGSRLSSSLDNVQMVARLASNVFIAMLPNVNATNFAPEAEQIIELFQTPFSVYTVNIDLDVLVGVCFYPEDGVEADILMQKADVALYGARFAAERYATYQRDKDPHHFNKLSLMSELREGLAQNEFEVYYQPKVSIEKGRIEQVEALIRWQHSIKGFMPPDQFIPLAEETGNIKKLTFWLIEKTFIQCKTWHRQGVPLLISINLSVKDLLNKRLVDYIASMLKEHEVDPAWIIFEIVESAFMYDPENAMKAIHKIKELGVEFSIDDYGTGYSSLSYLKKLPVNEIKIDKSFVQEITRSERVAHIVRSTIELGHNVGMRIVCEGLSDNATYEMLKTFKCDLGQGYFFSQPLSLKEFTQWLKISPWGIPSV